MTWSLLSGMKSSKQFCVKRATLEEAFIQRNLHYINHKDISLEQTEVTRTMTAVYEGDFSKPITSVLITTTQTNIFKVI